MALMNPFSFAQFFRDNSWKISCAAQLMFSFKAEAMFWSWHFLHFLLQSHSEHYSWSGSETFKKGPQCPLVAQTQNGILISIILIQIIVKMAQRHKLSWLKVWGTDKQNLILYFSNMVKTLVQVWMVSEWKQDGRKRKAEWQGNSNCHLLELSVIA